MAMQTLRQRKPCAFFYVIQNGLIGVRIALLRDDDRRVAIQ